MVAPAKSKTFEDIRNDLRSRTEAEQRQRNEQAIQRILAWVNDDSGYDEQMWPVIKRLISEHRLADREPFGE